MDALDQTVKTTAVSVTTTATPLPATPQTDRQSFLIQNLGPADLYLGGADVTSANGIKIVAGGTFSDEAFGPRVLLYGRTASSTADVRVMELS